MLRISSIVWDLTIAWLTWVDTVSILTFPAVLTRGLFDFV